MSYNYIEHDNDTLSFGKFSTRIYKDVYEKEKKYCKWLMEQESTYKNTIKFQQYVRFRSAHENTPQDIEPIEFIRRSATNATKIYEIMPMEMKKLFWTYRKVINKGKYKPTNEAKELEEKMSQGTKYNELLSREQLIFESSPLLQQLRSDEQGIFCDYYIRHQIAKVFDLPLVDNRAELIKDTLGEAYEHYKNKTATPMEIYLTCTAHSIFFKHTLSEVKTPFPNDFKFVDVEDWIETKIKPGLKKIELDPTLGNRELMISADADLILNEDEIIDIKYVKRTFENRYFLQLLIYAACYKVLNDKYVSKLTIMNFKELETITWQISHEAIDKMIAVLKESYIETDPKLIKAFKEYIDKLDKEEFDFKSLNDDDKLNEFINEWMKTIEFEWDLCSNIDLIKLIESKKI